MMSQMTKNHPTIITDKEEHGNIDVMMEMMQQGNSISEDRECVKNSIKQMIQDLIEGTTGKINQTQ